MNRLKDVCANREMKSSFFPASSGHDRRYRALRSIRMCEVPAGLSLFSQRVRTETLYEHSGVHAASCRQFIFFSAEPVSS